MWNDVYQVPHVKIGQQADLVIVAPATADLLAKAVSGRADDLLTSTLLTTQAPVIFAPAMHTEMWQHPATVANVAILRKRGNIVVDPASGRLTGADTGPGRLPEAAALMGLCRAALERPGDHSAPLERDLEGLRIVITAGGTREPLDPVRFLGNRSSGKQGWALANAAVLRGASVEVISANVARADPAGSTLTHVHTARELQRAVDIAYQDADVIVMAAAVADFEAASIATGKIKKPEDGSVPILELQRTPDVLAGLGNARSGKKPVLIGFAAETVETQVELIDAARLKLRAKCVDAIVANRVGASLGLGTETNAVSIVSADPLIDTLNVPTASKEAIAHAVLDIAKSLSVRAEVSA